MAVDPTGPRNITPPPVAPKSGHKTDKSDSPTSVKNTKPRLPKKPVRNKAPTTALQARKITRAKNNTNNSAPNHSDIKS